MNFMEYVCRGMIRSEDAIKRLNKRVNKLAKCNNQLSASLVCMGIAGILTLSVIAEQDKEIRALKKRISTIEAAREPVNEVDDDTEEQNEQEGA